MVEEIKITDKNPFLVDVPVRVNIWIRPRCQRLQFEVLRQARPSIIFLQSDGGRNEKEWEAIRQNRKIFDEEVDWNCTLYKIYEDHNNGLYTMGKKVSNVIWSKVDRCVFLEDDHIPSVCFFQYCAEMLERYKDDQRIECICGMNHLGVSQEVNSDYFFSREGSIWGIAQWRDRYMKRDVDFEYGNDPYVMNLLRQRTKKRDNAWRRILGYTQDKRFDGHVAGGEFYFMFGVYAQSRFYIVPKYNMINCIGYGDDAAHTGGDKKLMSKEGASLFDMKTYEYTFPLKHAKYVIPDEDYLEKVHKILGMDFTWKEKKGKAISHYWRLLTKGGPKVLLKVLNQRFSSNQVLES